MNYGNIPHKIVMDLNNVMSYWRGRKIIKKVIIIISISISIISIISII
jgi:hypothetical protein